MLTPVEIEVLLACYYSAEPFNGLRASPAVEAALTKWLFNGCIVQESIGADGSLIMRTTEKGERIVAALRNVQVPE